MSASQNFITCQRCKGMGDVVVAWDEAEHGPRKSEWDDATEDCPEHLLITSEELADLLRNFAATLATTEGSTP